MTAESKVSNALHCGIKKQNKESNRGPHETLQTLLKVLAPLKQHNSTCVFKKGVRVEINQSYFDIMTECLTKTGNT